jgi:hypothetical protein
MTPPVYQPNIPQPGHTIARGQQDFLNDFASLYTAFMTNHIPLDATSNAGNHTFLQMAEQMSAPQTQQGEISVYVKNIPGQTDQVFLKYQSGTELQLTNYQLFAITPTTTEIRYFTMLPGKIIVFFGTFFPAIQTQQKITPGAYFAPFIAKNIITFNTVTAPGSLSPSPLFNMRMGRPGIVTNAELINQGLFRAGISYIALANI